MAARPASRLRIRLLAAAIFLAAIPPAYGQAEDEPASEPPRENPYGTGAGLSVLLTNNGFGLGGYYSHELGPATSLLIETSLGPGKDERELKFFSRFGDGFIPNKFNYLLMLPLQFGIQQRLFRESIEDNFRPYIQFSGGPTVGWEYPYFKDENGNERYDEDIDRRYDVFTGFPHGALRMGMGGTLAIGAYFGFSRKMTQGVRFGYTVNYFLEGIELLEPDIKPAQHSFHTPVISITFGRIF